MSVRGEIVSRYHVTRQGETLMFESALMTDREKYACRAPRSDELS